MAKNKDIPSYEDTVAYEDTSPLDEGVPSYEDTVAEDRGPSMGGAVSREFSKKAALGFADEIGAASGALGERAEKQGFLSTISKLMGASATPTDEMGRPLSQDLDETMRAAKATQEEGDAFAEAYNRILPEVREEQALQTEADIEANPYAARAAGMAGSMVPFLATGGAGALARTGSAMSKAPTILGRLQQGASLGFKEAVATTPQAALLGAAQGIGDTEDKSELGDTATNAALGAALGAGTNLALSPAVGLTGAGLGMGYDATKKVASKVGSKLGPALSSLAEAVTPKFVKDLAIDPFTVNLEKGVNTITEKGRSAIREKGIEAAKKTSSEIVEYQNNILSKAAKDIKDIANNISSTVAKGSQLENKAIAEQQLVAAQNLLEELVTAGEASGKGIGDMMRGAKGTTSALKDGVIALEKAMADNPYLQNEEALAVLNQFKQAITTGGREVKIPLTTITREGGEEGTETLLKDALKSTGAMTEQEAMELARLPREELEAALVAKFPDLKQTKLSTEAIKVPNKEFGEMSERMAFAEQNTPELLGDLQAEAAAMGGPEKVIGTKTTKELVGKIPGTLKEMATAPEYLNTVSAIDDAIRKAGKDSSLGKVLSEYRRNLVSQGRSDLLGESKTLADQYAKQYGAFKDLINQSNLGSKKELSDSLLKQLSNITKDPDTASQLNKFNSLKETIATIDPKLAQRLEEQFMKLSAAKEAIPEAKTAKSVAGFLQKGLPEAQSSAAASLEKEAVFEPFARYAGQETAAATEAQALKIAQMASKAEEAIKTADVNKFISALQTEAGAPTLKTQEYISQLKDLLNQISPDRKDAFMKQHADLLKQLAVASQSEAASPFMAKALAFLRQGAAVAGKVTGELGRTLPTAVKKASKLPLVNNFADRLEQKGLVGAATTARDVLSSDPVRAAAANYSASQIPALRNLLKETEEE
jgi:hypothetical protein